MLKARWNRGWLASDEMTVDGGWACRDWRASGEIGDVEELKRERER